MSNININNNAFIKWENDDFMNKYKNMYKRCLNDIYNETNDNNNITKRKRYLIDINSNYNIRQNII